MDWAVAMVECVPEAQKEVVWERERELARLRLLQPLLLGPRNA